MFRSSMRVAAKQLPFSKSPFPQHSYRLIMCLNTHPHLYGKYSTTPQPPRPVATQVPPIPRKSATESKDSKSNKPEETVDSRPYIPTVSPELSPERSSQIASELSSAMAGQASESQSPELDAKLSDDYKKSTSRMLRDLEKKKEDLNLTPKQFSDRLESLQKKALDILSKIPPLLWKGTVFVSDKSLEFLKNPLIVKEWYAHIKAVAKKEAKHYWSGAKLFYADIKSATRILSRVVQGHAISRREKMQLRRAVADVFRMVPFLAFVVIPFLEFFLPLAIKIFPNMLPSQFEDKMQREEQIRRKLRARLELAKFLQDTVELMVVDLKKNKNAETVATAQELHKFIKNIREGGEVQNEDLVRFAKLFNDELTLDSIERSQLVAMCRFMDIPPFGSEAILRFHLRSRLRQLKADDRLIYWEGVNSLSVDELMFACQERGMRIGLPKPELRRQLNEWLQLSLDFNIPSTLLILSRAFRFTADTHDEAIKMAIGSLPKNAIDEVLMDQHEEGVSINEKKLESLRRQERLIEEEVIAQTEKDEKSAAPAEDIDHHFNEYRKVVSTMVDDKSSLRDERRELDALSGEHETVNDELLENESQDARVRRVHQYVGKVIGELEVEIDEAQGTLSSSFHKLDKDRDGFISVDEVREVNRYLKNKPSDELMEKIIEKLDKNKDGKISVSALRAELLQTTASKELSNDDWTTKR